MCRLISPYRCDVSFNMLQSHGPIRGDVAPGEWSLHGWRGWRRGGGAKQLQLMVHHILPISLQFQTTGFGEMTVGAADCEINWTCDPRGRDQLPAGGGERASRAYISLWQKNSQAQRLLLDMWSVSSTRCLRTWLSFAWLVWHCRRVCETCCHAVVSC